jgi:predicted nuclease of restriction endonuclease-like (RecB) superfamily
MSESLPTNPGYTELLGQLKDRIRTAQVRAASSVNRELVMLYWSIGRDILVRQEAEGWGAKVIDRLAEDLRRAFPETRGFSARNIKYMRRFAEAWPDGEIVQQLVAQIPWGHNVRILDKVQRSQDREWYVRAAIEHGWSRAVLEAQIDTRLIDRQGAAPSNFQQTLPAPQSDLAQQLLKDPYKLDFLTLAADVEERELEKALTDHVTDFLVELGRGFAYVGRQVPLEVGGEDYYIDLLFYHVKLHCYVVIELKAREFKPEYAGKLNFYLSAADDLLRDATVDNPTIGILLCKSKKNIVVEYALRKMGQPIGVSEIELASTLPDELKDKLPTVEQLERELESEGD